MIQIQIKKLKAFTLVELIIVITILAILATIAFVSFQNYTKDARDSARMTSLKNIESGLQAFQITTGNYSDPENAINIQASGSMLSQQGIVGDTVSKLIKSNPTPTDPFDGSKYIYAVNNLKTKYQLLSYLENQNETAYITTAYALDLSQRKPKTIGDNVGILLNQDNSAVSGGSIDILKANSGSQYKATFGNNDIVSLSGTGLYSNIYNRRSDLLNNKSIANLDESLVGYWDMETISSTGGLKDSSKYKNDGSIYGTNLTKRGNNIAMSFNGINEEVITPDSSVLRNNGNFSVSFWMKENNFANTYPGIIGKGNGQSSDSYMVFYSSNNTIYYKRNNIQYQTGPDVVTKSWRFVTYTYNGDKFRWYVDGKLNASYTVTFTTNNGVLPLTFSHGDYYSNISLDEIRFYNRELSSSEISSLYNETK